MSISIMTYCWRVPLETNSEKLVLMKLADHASDDGECYPSWSHLQVHTGLSRATVARALSSLESRGLIARRSRAGTSTMYYLDVDAIKKATPIAFRGHSSKGYEKRGEIKPSDTEDDPSHSETTPSHGETTTRLMVRPRPSHGETLTIIEPSELTIKESLRKIHGRWCDRVGDVDKKTFAKYMTSIAEREDTDCLLIAIDKYTDETDAKYVTLKSFSEKYKGFMGKPFKFAYDKNSDLSKEDQYKYQKDNYDRYGG